MKGEDAENHEEQAETCGWEQFLTPGQAAIIAAARAATAACLFSLVPVAKGESAEEVTLAVSGGGFGLLAMLPDPLLLLMIMIIMIIVALVILYVEVKTGQWKNEYLQQRVIELEATLDQKNQQIERLDEMIREARMGPAPWRPAREEEPPRPPPLPRQVEHRTVMTQSMCTYARQRARPEFVYIDRGAAAGSGAWVQY